MTSEWREWLHQQLPRPHPSPAAPVVLDLFAGCGGLALPFEVSGFRTIGYEAKPVAVETYAANLVGECKEVWLDVGLPEEPADVIIGGPPCQPFSQFGYQRGKRDARDGFPVFTDAVRRLQPQIAILENVRGLLYRNKGYLRAVAQQLHDYGYAVDARVLHAVHYGVPQRRQRVVLVASRVGWAWPEISDLPPVSVGEALGASACDEHPHDKHLTAKMDRYIAKYEAQSQCVTPRDLHLDRPARTVTCRNLGGATADMLRLRLPSGRRRQLTVREGARLQGFPDWFAFHGTEAEQFEQVGNAVPPLLGLALARQVEAALATPHPLKGVPSMNQGLLADDRIAARVDQALTILRAIGLPVRDLTPRRKTRVAKALLAVAGLTPQMTWSEATSFYTGTAAPVTTRAIIKFWNAHYGEEIKDASYDDVRRKDLVLLVEAGLVARSAADPAADTNDGTRGYAIPLAALALLQNYGTEDWEHHLLEFRRTVGAVQDRLSKARDFQMVPVTLPSGERYRLTPGPHNEIQKAVIEEFLPRFSRGAQVLYLGDTAKKILHIDRDALANVGIQEIDRKTLPDVIAYEAERGWLFLIEAVHSSNPVSPMRHLALRRLLDGGTHCLYISAFASKALFARFSKEISWETEVWLAEDPDHMIHFDGGRFLAPYTGSREETP